MGFRPSWVFVILPALQKTFVNFSFEFAFLLKIWHCKMAGILVNFLCSPFPRKESAKTRRIWGNSEHFSEQNSGRHNPLNGLFSD